MGRVRRRVWRKLALEQAGIVLGLVAAIAAELIYLGRSLWLAVTGTVVAAIVLSIMSWRRTMAVLRSPMITVMELRKRRESGEK